MPSVPIPQQVPIERAGWSPDFNPGAYTPSDNIRSPINPIDSGLNQAAQQAQAALQNSQAANQVSEVQQRQRAQQASMINAALQTPGADLPTIIGAANKLNPSRQIDPTATPDMLKAIAMSSVPVEQQPTYSLNQSKAAINQALLQALGGTGGVTSAQEGNQSGNPSPAIGGSGGISPAAQNLLAIAMPEASSALNNTKRTEFDSPAGKAETALEIKNADNLADSQKTFNATYSMLPLALQRFQKLRDAAPNASYGLGSGGFDQSFANNKLGHAINPEAAAANQTIKQVANQGLISELGPSLQGMKPNKFLESISSKGNLINPEDIPQVKLQAIDNIQNQYIGQLKSLAAQRRAYGDKTAPSDAEIDAQVASLKSQSSNTSNSSAPKTGTIEGGYIFMGGDPADPKSWRPTK